MKTIVRSILAPVISLVFLMFGASLLTTFISVFLKLKGFSINIISLMTAAYFTGIVIGSIRCYKFIERVGHIRAYSALASAFSICALFFAIVINPWLWLILRFLCGFFLAGLLIAIESWLLGKSSSSNKGKILSIYMISFYVSQGVGQLFFGTFDPNTNDLVFLIVIFIMFSIIPVCITKIAAPLIEETIIYNFFKLFKKSPLGTCGCIISGATLGSMYGLLPVYIQNIGLPLNYLGFIMGAFILGGFILQWPLGHLSDVLDRRKILAWTGWASSITAFLLILSTYAHVSMFIIMLILFGGFAFTIYPLSISYATDRVESKNLNAAIAVMSIAYGFGAIIGPIISSFSMQLLGPNGIFAYIIILGSILGFYGLRRIAISTPTPPEEKVPYRNVPSQPSSIPHTEIDPRSEEKLEEHQEKV